MVIGQRNITKFLTLVVVFSIFYCGLIFAEGINDWIQWRDDYLTQVESIKAAAVQKNEETANWSDHRRALLVGKDSDEKAIKELEALKVPPELQQYHQKLIEGYNLIIQNVDAWLRGDAQAAVNFGLKAVECEKESYKELRRVAEQHEASKEDLGIIDRWIASFPK